MHPILERQLKHFLGVSIDSLPSAWKQFVSAIDETYRHFDENRELSERSFDLSSKEYAEQKTRLEAEKKALEEKAAKLSSTLDLLKQNK